MWYVNIIEEATGDVVETIKAKTEKEAERIERGVEINLNHEKYYCVIVGPKQEQ